MSRLAITACVLLTVTCAHTQYVDFFQSFNTFLQPFTTVRPKNEATKRPEAKHRQTNKQKYQDLIFFDTDDFLKQRETSKNVDPFNLFTTTTKPKRKNVKTTTSHSHNTTTSKSSKVDNRNKATHNNNNNNNRNMPEARSVSNNNPQNNVDRTVNNARRIDSYNNNFDNGFNVYNFNGDTTKFGYGQVYTRPTTQRTTTTNYYHRPSTQRTTTNYYNRPTTQRTTTSNYYNIKTTPNYDYYGRLTTNIFDDRTTNRPNTRRTTKNPLLHRPGVKPAVVDENRPPITNRPVTSRPYQPGTYRPDSRPLDPRPANTRPVDPRPVNTRPPFETERPLTTGVARPIDRPAPSRPANKPVSNENTEVDIEIGPDEDEMSDAEKRRLYDVCEQKCDEYKSMRVKKVVALPLAGQAGGVEVNVSSCTPDTAPLIIGGQLAKIETFPHMALLGWRNIQGGGYKWKCGGSLLSERYVLTAGHCTYHDKDYNVVSGPPSAVQLGSSIYNDRSATVVEVSLVVRHPKYKLRRSYYDVALLKLAVDVTFSDTIMPACLGVPPPVGEPVVATGWGKTEFGGDSSIQLRSVSIPIWDMSDCRDIWGTSLKLPNGPMPDNQICAGEKMGAKDTCQGDSGGPAQVRDGCAWRVVAVTSVGRSCGAPETPALYATVPRAFIAKQVYTNVKTGRDGGTQYGNQGSNNNNNNNNRNNGNNRDNNNNYQQGNRGVTIPSPSQYNYGQNNARSPNNGQNNNNNARLPNNNDQYYNQGTVSNTRDVVVNSGSYGQNNRNNNNGYNNANNNGYNANNNGYNANNNGYNTNNNNNNGYVDVYGSNVQTTNRYDNQNNYGQNNNNNYNVNNFGQNYEQTNRYTESPSDVGTFDAQSFGYNNNGNIDNTYNRDNGYNIYPVINRPWWTK